MRVSARWAIKLAVAIVAVAVVAGITRTSAAQVPTGHWRYLRTEVTPTQAELDRIKPPPGRVHEQRVTGAFQALFAGKGSLELFFKTDDVDHKVYTSRVLFNFGTATDMSTLTAGTVLKFEGSTDIESNFPGAKGQGRMAVDNADYFLDIEATKDKPASARGEFKVPGGSAGATMRIYATAHIGAYGALNAAVTNFYEWVAGPPPVPSPSASPTPTPAPTPTPGGVAGGSGFGGTWRTSEGDVSLTQSGARVTGQYSQDNGRLEGEVRGTRLVGYWAETKSDHQCTTQRMGSFYWGRIDWTLTPDGSRFSGQWSYCDGSFAKVWTGERIGAAPDPAASTGFPAPVAPGTGAPVPIAPGGAWPQGPASVPTTGPSAGPTTGPTTAPTVDRSTPQTSPDSAALGSRLDVTEPQGWTGVWTRRPGTDIFDATWRNAAGGTVRDVIRVEGWTCNTVTLKRDGNGGRYYGTISPDGQTITGTASWYPPGTAWWGRITRGSASGGQPTVPTGPAPVVKLSDNWNTAACGFTDTATLDIGQPTRLARLDLWVNWRANEGSIGYRVLHQGRDIGGGVLRRGDCDPYQAAWCVATDSLAVDLEPGRYVVRIDRAGLCQNRASGGVGFIRSWGSRR